MSVVFHELARLEHRILGALRCVDLASGAAIDSALQIGADDARLLRNRSGLYVILDWSPLADYADSFSEQPDETGLFEETLSLVVRDPTGHYLPRLVDVDLPRDPDPDNADNASSLFRSIDVPMYPSPSGPVLANWASLRVSVVETVSGDALGGAFVRVISNGDTIARGLTDWRGEALVPVVGIPITTWSDDPHAVIVSEIAAQVEVYFDPVSGTRTSMSSVTGGLTPQTLPLVNPDVIEAGAGTLPTASAGLNLAAGRQYTLSMEVSIS